jgi:methyl-accepting chemotaxis protein
MLGPKLDARSYAILVLVVIAVVMSSTLVAQQFGTSSTVRSSSDATAEVAEANRQIAEALKEIARSNREIAGSIDRLSRSVGEIKDAVGRAQSQQAATSARVVAPQSVEPAAADGAEPTPTPSLQMLR